MKYWLKDVLVGFRVSLALLWKVDRTDMEFVRDGLSLFSRLLYHSNKCFVFIYYKSAGPAR